MSGQNGWTSSLKLSDVSGLILFEDETMDGNNFSTGSEVVAVSTFSPNIYLKGTAIGKYRLSFWGAYAVNVSFTTQTVQNVNAPAYSTPWQENDVVNAELLYRPVSMSGLPKNSKVSFCMGKTKVNGTLVQAYEGPEPLIQVQPSTKNSTATFVNLSNLNINCSK